METTELKQEYDRVVAILKGVADGSKKIENVPCWGFCGNTTIKVDGYMITFFIDCGDLDYVESVTTPNVATIAFGDFWKAFYREPVEELSEIEIGNIEDVILGFSGFVR